MDLKKLDEAERNLIIAMVNEGMPVSQAVSFIVNFGEC